MTVVGANNFADAPLLTVGTSSAYTPNAGYTTETDEPTAWGGKTAWWRVEAGLGGFFFIDVLYSTGSTRAWVYRSFVTDPVFADLSLVNDPGADTQGGWIAAEGGHYYIRLDSDGSNVSYVASVGARTFDEYTERRFLHGPGPENPTFPWHVRENYFYPEEIASPIESAWPAHYYGLVDEHVDGAPGGTATMHVEAFADDVIADYPSFFPSDWYTHSAGAHPILIFGSTSAGGGAVDDPPLGFELNRARIYVTAGSSEGPPVPAESDGEVSQITLAGEFDSGPLRYFDENGSVAGDVPFDGPSTEVEFRLPVGFAADTALTDYHAGGLAFQLAPNPSGSTVNPEPYPVGSWFVYAVEIEFIFRSEEPFPYEPPPPPAALSVIRQFPSTSPGAWGGGPRTFPAPNPRPFGGFQ